MAEISYPFNADNSTTGAAKAVSETQWHSMAHMWGGDRVDFMLGPQMYTSLDLPFSLKVINNTTVQINPGRAWVGGFYYELTTPQNVLIDSNTTPQGRIDLVVIRLDMAKPAVNLAVHKGINGATPVAPQPFRQSDGFWEIPIWEVSVPANAGTLAPASRHPFNMPPAVSFSWNAAPSSNLTPMGTFTYDLDSDGTGPQQEYFKSRDGLIRTRTLGKTYSYTPAVLNDKGWGAVPGSTSTGNWRWIAPNTIHFSLTIANGVTHSQTDSGVAYGIRLPIPANPTHRQVFNGILNNPSSRDSTYPPFTTLAGFCSAGASPDFFTVYIPSPTSPASGLNNFRFFPAQATVHFSGTYEANMI
ncbi:MULTISPECIES: hypothetical protein [unclassified Streptomyces]|uniref:hypothetical protein n=1 Tax=Streptomyces sp. NPDC055082 TaxID=3365718 RepID=UPI0037CE2216